MFLNAIGIYQEQDNMCPGTGLKKVKYAQQDKSILFPCNQLENIDDYLLKSTEYSALELGKIYNFKKDDDYSYLYHSKSAERILAISSRTPVDSLELAFLFKNIEHIIIRPDKVNKTLDNIIANPLEYTNKEILIESVKENIEELKRLMYSAIEKIVQRGENLEQLKNKALHLENSAIKFEDKAKTLNSCCW